MAAISIGLSCYFIDKHVARYLLILSSVISMFLVVNRYRLIDFKRKEYLLWPMSLGIFLLSTGHGWLVHGGDVDYKRFKITLEITLMGVFIYWYLLSRKPDSTIRSLLFWCLAGGLAIAGFLALLKWHETNFLDRIWLETKRINISAGTLLLLLASVSVFLLSLRSRLLTLICCLSVGLGVVGVYASGSRGAWLGIAALLCITGFWLICNRSGKIKKISLLLLVMLIMVGGMLQFSDSFNQRLETTTTSIERYLNQEGTFRTSSVGTRFEMWHSAVNSIADNPLHGLGGAPLLERLKHKEHSYLFSNNNPHVHNDILEAGQSRGLLGLVSVIFLLVMPAYIGWVKRSNEYGRVLLTVALVFFVVCLFDSFLVTKFSLFYYISIISVLSALALKSDPENG